MMWTFYLFINKAAATAGSRAKVNMIHTFFTPKKNAPSSQRSATTCSKVSAVYNNFLRIKKEHLTDEQLFTCRSQLTIVPRVPTFIKNLKSSSSGGSGEKHGFYAFGETQDEIWLPRFYDIHKVVPKANFGPVTYEVNAGTPMSPGAAQAFTGKLHEQGQRQAFEAILHHFFYREEGNPLEAPSSSVLRGGVVQLPCGFGKTVLSIAIASHLGVRSLVLVHTEDLMEQWKNRIKQFLPGASVGLVHQKKNCLETNLSPQPPPHPTPHDAKDGGCGAGEPPPTKRRRRKKNSGGIVENEEGSGSGGGYLCSDSSLPPDFAIGMIQSISSPSCSYDPASFDTVGLVIVDECHHIAANYFSTSLHKLKPTYILGLSATPDRKDGLQFLLHWYLGPMLYTCDEREFRDGGNTQVVRISYEGGQQKVCLTRTRDELRPIMINKLAQEHARNDLLVNLLVSIPAGRKVLVLSARVDQVLLLEKKTSSELQKLHDMRKCGLYYGAIKKTERNRVASECDYLFGTYNIAAEGLDIPRLDTLVYATPTGDVKQAVGRILRIHPDKSPPLIVDIVDPFSFFETQSRSRATFYRKQGYSIENLMHPAGSPLGEDIVSALSRNSLQSK